MIDSPGSVLRRGCRYQPRTIRRHSNNEAQMQATVSPQLAYWQTGRTPLPLRRDSVPSKDTLDEKTRSQRHYVDFAIVNSQNSQAYHPHYHRYSTTADSNIEPCPTRCWWNVSRETFHQHHPVPGIITLSVGCVISGIHSNVPSIHPPSMQHQNRRNSGFNSFWLCCEKSQTEHSALSTSCPPTPHVSVQAPPPQARDTHGHDRRGIFESSSPPYQVQPVRNDLSKR